MAASGTKTIAQRLQDCQNENGQLRHELERNLGAAEKLTEALGKIAELEGTRVETNAVTQAERRRYEELIREAQAERDSWTKRASMAEQTIRNQNATLDTLREMVRGRDCILPHIARLLGVT